MKGKLFLIPTVIAEGTQEQVIPDSVRKSLAGMKYFLCENIRTARRFISSLNLGIPIESLHFEVLDKDTKKEALKTLMSPIGAGNNMALLSESGCPGVADPGSIAVDYAHRNDIKVVPLTGPSSIILALMASGMNGQQFTFHGYLPVDAKEAGDAIRILERESREKRQTQIFIETPYRNNAVLGHLLKSLRDDTLLSVATDLTSEKETIIRQEVGLWKKNTPVLEKAPAVFLFLAVS